MHNTYPARRAFLKAAGAAAAAGLLPAARGQTVRLRPEWSEFRASGSFAGYINAIRAMRSNTNGSDRRSWAYWTNIHTSICPHGVPYFLAWHRGYLHYFQKVVRELSGDSTLMIPYWDYYRNPVMPPEFTDPAPDNPLYVEGRKNTDVRASLTLSPFLGKYTNFRRGLPDAFEPVIETGPHGTLHNIIGGAMASMSSPMDPIFWLHHAQLDRLWAAWAAAGAGRQMPPPGDAYWSGYHTYTPMLKMARSMTHDTATRLYYDFADKAMPASLPPPAETSGPAAAMDAGVLRRPPTVGFEPSAPRNLGKRRAVGGVRQVALGESPVTARIQLDANDGALLRAVVPAPADKRRAGPAPRFRYANLVLDDARTTGAGGEGGYFYEVYLNLPLTGGENTAPLLAGRFGAFELDATGHHGRPARLSFPLTPVLEAASPPDMRELAVSFIRRDGNSTPGGAAINVGELRIELSNQSG